MIELRELLRHIRAEPSDRGVQRATGVHRQTVKAYRAWAAEQGVLAGELPTLEELHRLVAATLGEPPPPQNVSSVEAYRSVVLRLRQEGVEIAAIWERLKERGYAGSYSSVWRFVRGLEPAEVDVTVRVERKPGEEAQVDFGYAGRMLDEASGELRKAWAFVMTLSWSRHQYIEFVWDQKLTTWLAAHRRAFEFFGGVPQRLVVDNLKAAITQARWDDVLVQASYRECAQHYGFLIAPCRPLTPEHKGKVEQGGVHYVKRNFLGGRRPTSLAQANRDVRAWCLTTAGTRVHGTTKAQPLSRFEQNERALLLPLPEAPYDLATWKVVRLHRDCYLTFEQRYYSAPFRLVGQKLRVRGGAQQVRIYTLDYQLVATHERAEQPGTRRTHPDHLPPHKLPGLLLDRATVLTTASEIGSATHALVEALLSDPAVDRLPSAGKLVRLRERYSAERLEAACARAIQFDECNYQTVKRILTHGLEQKAVVTPAPEPAAQTFIRSAMELMGHLFGGRLTWN